MKRQFKPMKPKFLKESEINFIRGKASVGAATPEELLSVFSHYDMLDWVCLWYTVKYL